MLLEVSLCEVVKEFEDRILENVSLGEEAGKAVIPRAPAVVLRNVGKQSVRRTPMTSEEREGAPHDLKLHAGSAAIAASVPLLLFAQRV
jgi:hypothetical protein